MMRPNEPHKPAHATTPVENKNTERRVASKVIQLDQC